MTTLSKSRKHRGRNEFERAALRIVRTCDALRRGYGLSAKVVTAGKVLRRAIDDHSLSANDRKAITTASKDLQKKLRACAKDQRDPGFVEELSQNFGAVIANMRCAL